MKTNASIENLVNRFSSAFDVIGVHRRSSAAQS
jgi:hypothetical protein